MHLDPLSTLEGRHLVFIYAAVIFIQGGYFCYIGLHWLRLRRTEHPVTPPSAGPPVATPAPDPLP